MGHLPVKKRASEIPAELAASDCPFPANSASLLITVEVKEIGHASRLIPPGIYLCVPPTQFNNVELSFHPVELRLRWFLVHNNDRKFQKIITIENHSRFSKLTTYYQIILHGTFTAQTQQGYTKLYF